MKHIKWIWIILLMITTGDKPKTYTTYLPMVRHDERTLQLSTYLEGVTEGRIENVVPGQWIGVGVSWSIVEAVKGEYDWSRYDSYDLVKGWPLIIQVKNSPTWARTIPGWVCSPPKPEYYQDFASFVIAIIDRYHPQAVTIWNEPEAPPSVYIGCWESGKQYGEFLAEIYPIIKQAHPEVLFVGGELLLGNEHKTFASEVVEYGKFDVLSFHAYVGWPHTNYDAALEKARYLRTLTDATLWLTETSYLDDVEGHNQADYLQYLYDNADDIELIQWYTLAGNGWRNSDLVYKNTKRPAWYVFDELIQ